MNEQEKSEALGQMARDCAEAYGRGFDAFKGQRGAAIFYPAIANRLEHYCLPDDNATLHRLNDMVQNLLSQVWRDYDRRREEFALGHQAPPLYSEVSDVLPNRGHW